MYVSPVAIPSWMCYNRWSSIRMTSKDIKAMHVVQNTECGGLYNAVLVHVVAYTI